MTFFKELKELQKNCYAKYSKYKVASILIDDKNKVFKGVNVENASFGLTICAERSALVNAITNGAKKIREVHLLCSNKKTFGIPCGMCRQTLAEFMDDDGLIYIYNSLGEVEIYTLGELIPKCFRKTYFNKE